MTQEGKQLLLKDLCARLPYGVKIEYLYWDENKGCVYPVPMKHLKECIKLNSHDKRRTFGKDKGRG